MRAIIEERLSLGSQCKLHLLMDNFQAKTSQQIPCILDVDLLGKTNTTHKNGEHTPKNAAWFIVWHIPEMDPKVPSGHTFKI